MVGKHYHMSKISFVCVCVYALVYPGCNFKPHPIIGPWFGSSRILRSVEPLLATIVPWSVLIWSSSTCHSHSYGLINMFRLAYLCKWRLGVTDPVEETFQVQWKRHLQEHIVMRQVKYLHCIYFQSSLLHLVSGLKTVGDERGTLMCNYSSF